MLRAYVINSRVQDASQLTLAQPYSPQLFSQGTLPGPTMLLEVLTDVKTPREAMEAWKIDKGLKAGEDEDAKGRWPEPLSVCRRK